jgi:hypothetical protein
MREGLPRSYRSSARASTRERRIRALPIGLSTWSDASASRASHARVAFADARARRALRR